MRVIKHPVVKQKEKNIESLLILINQYVKVNEKEVLKKVKAEQ